MPTYQPSTTGPLLVQCEATERGPLRPKPMSRFQSKDGNAEKIGKVSCHFPTSSSSLVSLEAGGKDRWPSLPYILATGSNSFQIHKISEKWGTEFAECSKRCGIPPLLRDVQFCSQFQKIEIKRDQIRIWMPTFSCLRTWNLLLFENF